MSCSGPERTVRSSGSSPVPPADNPRQQVPKIVLTSKLDDIISSDVLNKRGLFASQHTSTSIATRCLLSHP